MKLFKYLTALSLLAFLAVYCTNNTPKKTATAEIIAVANQTHKEAADTLLADSTAPRKPLVYRKLSQEEAKKVLESINIGTILAKNYPDNGFYGSDHYRIEFIATKAEKTINNPFVYAIEGKNRYKKTISSFSGVLEIAEVTMFTDPNLNVDDLKNMEIKESYTMSGTFRLGEDTTLQTSGAFTGTFKVDLAVKLDGTCDYWYYSLDAPTKGGGYVFEGNWSQYNKKTVSKPFLWASDLFAIANDILSDFSYGEREVEINPKYRHLGWESFWDGEEWWHDSEKSL